MNKPAPMTLAPRQPAKGAAVASVSAIETAPAPIEPPAAPAPAPVPPAAITPAPAPAPLPPNVKALGGMVAVTVRMDVETYERLKIYGARTRQTNQTIVLDAIKRVLP